MEIIFPFIKFIILIIFSTIIVTHATLAEEKNKYLTPDLGGTSSSQTLTDHIIDKIENYE